MAAPALHFLGGSNVLPFPKRTMSKTVAAVIPFRVAANDNVRRGFSQLEEIGKRAKRLARRQALFAAAELIADNLAIRYRTEPGYSTQGWTEICNIGPYDHYATPDLLNLCGANALWSVATLGTLVPPYTQGPDGSGNYLHTMGLWKINAVLPGPTYNSTQNQVWQKTTGSPTEPAPSYVVSYPTVEPSPVPLTRDWQISPRIRPGVYKLGSLRVVSPGGELSADGFRNKRGEGPQYVISSASRGVRVTAGYGGHFQTPPSRNEREQKGKAQKFVRQLMNFVGGAEEMVDIIHSATYNDNGVKVSKYKIVGVNGWKVRKNVKDMLLDIWKFHDNVSIAEFQFGMLDDVLEDVQIGAQQEFIKKGLGNRGGSLSLTAGPAL